MTAALVMLSHSRHVWASRVSQQIHKESRKQIKKIPVRQHVTLSCQEPVLWKQEDVEIENPVDSLEMTVKGLAWRSLPALSHFVPASFCWIEFSPLDSTAVTCQNNILVLEKSKKGNKRRGETAQQRRLQGYECPR